MMSAYIQYNIMTYGLPGCATAQALPDYHNDVWRAGLRGAATINRMVHIFLAILYWLCLLYLHTDTGKSYLALIEGYIPSTLEALLEYWLCCSST